MISADVFKDQFEKQWQVIDSKYRHFITKVEGIKWHYVEFNPHGVKTILFTNGMPECWYIWSKVAPLINGDYRCICLDSKGFGRSDTRDDNYNWHAIANEVVALMEKINAPTFTIAAHDWGVPIANTIVADHPSCVSKYIRSSVPLKMDLGYLWKNRQLILFKSKSIEKAMLGNPERLRRAFSPGRFAHQALAAEDVDYLIYEFLRPGVIEASNKYYRFDNKPGGLNNAFLKVGIPVLFIQGDSDGSCPLTYFKDIEKMYPDVKVAVIKNAGHFVPLEQPAVTAEAINAFLTKQ